MVVTTPVATIGVRGTAAAGVAAAEGELNTITLLSEEGGIVGEISVTNSTGTVVLNVANASVSVTSFFTTPSDPIILTNDQVNQLFGNVLSTLPPPPDGGGVDVGAVAPGQTNGNGEPNGDGQTGDGSDDNDDSDDTDGADNSDSDGEPATDGDGDEAALEDVDTAAGDGDGDAGDGANPFDADGGGPQSDSVEGDVLDESGDGGELLAVEVDFLDGDSGDGAEDGGSDTSVVEVPALDTAAETPDLDVEVATGAEDTPIGLTITAALKDLDGSESLAITIDGVPSGSILTADGQTIAIEDGSATLTPADLLNLNLTPPANFSGSIDLEVTATSTESNSGATADNIETLTVVVDPVADDPTLLSAPITGDEDTPINFTGLSAALNDTDGSETLSVTIAGIPSGATLFDDLAQQVIVSGGQATIADPARIVALDQFSITPPFNDDSDFQLTVTATSTEAANLDQASVQQIFDVTVVAVADTPTLSVAPLTVNEDTEIDFTGLSAALTDTDGSETLSVTISGIPAGARIFDNQDLEIAVVDGTVEITDPSEIAALSQFSIIPPPDDDSDFQLTATATSTESENQDQASIQQTFDVTVIAVADAPTLATTAISGNEDTQIDFTGLASALTDTDGSETLSVVISRIPDGALVFDDNDEKVDVEEGVATITDPDRLAALNLFSVKPPPDDDTDFTLTVTATTTETANGDQASVEQTFNVTVVAVADAPTLGIPGAPLVTNEDIAIDFTGLSSALTDTDGSETLSVTISTIPNGAKIFDDLGTELTISGNAVTITDPTQLTALSQFSVKPPPDDDTDFQLTVTATTTEVANGDQASAQQTFDVTVVAVADAPTLGVPGAPLVTNEDTAIDFTGLSSALTDTDGSETLSVTISSVPIGAKIFDDLGTELTLSGNAVTITDPTRLAALNLFSVKPPPGDDTDFQLTVTATTTEAANSDQASVVQTLDVTVVAVADAPTLAAPAAPLVGNEDTAIDFTGLSSALTDTDGSETLSVTISTIPNGAKIFDDLGTELPVSSNAVTITDPARLAALNLFSVKPPLDDDTNFQLTVTATTTETANGDQASVQQSFDITVNAVADAPALAVPGAPLVGNEDTVIDFTGLSSALTDTDARRRHRLHANGHRDHDRSGQRRSGIGRANLQCHRRRRRRRADAGGPRRTAGNQ